MTDGAMQGFEWCVVFGKRLSVSLGEGNTQLLPAVRAKHLHLSSGGPVACKSLDRFAGYSVSCADASQLASIPFCSKCLRLLGLEEFPSP